MSKRIAWFMVMLLPCAGQQSPQAAGKITGIVKGDDGSAIPGTSVALNLVQTMRNAKPKRPLPERDRQMKISGSGGLFSFDGLRQGQYQLCAQLAKSPWLNTCDWGSIPLTVTVSAGQTEAATIILRKGALVQIRVEDPARVLSQNQGTTPGAHLLLGVGGSDGLFRTAVLVSDDAGVRHYQSLVPFGLPIKLVMSSSFFQLADALGTPLQARTTSMTLTAQAGAAPPLVRVIVTGKRSQ